MLRIYNFLEWQEVRTDMKCQCEAYPSQVCCPSNTNNSCIFHYGEYVFDVLDDKFKQRDWTSKKYDKKKMGNRRM